MRRVSVDIGGTFTDCFMAWDNKYIEFKALTTHQNLALGFNEALKNACDDLNLKEHDLLSEVDSVRYATTLGTNALIQRKGPRLSMLTTMGFRSSVPLARAKGAMPRACRTSSRWTCRTHSAPMPSCRS